MCLFTEEKTLYHPFVWFRALWLLWRPPVRPSWQPAPDTWASTSLGQGSVLHSSVLRIRGQAVCCQGSNIDIDDDDLILYLFRRWSRHPPLLLIVTTTVSTTAPQQLSELSWPSVKVFKLIKQTSIWILSKRWVKSQILYQTLISSPGWSWTAGAAGGGGQADPGLPLQHAPPGGDGPQGPVQGHERPRQQHEARTEVQQHNCRGGI